jgi:FkbM family methyltransferase
VRSLIEASPLSPAVRPIVRLIRRVRRRSVVRKNDRYDAQTIEVMRRCLRPDSVGVDVGAFEGKVLADLARFAPNGQHHAFEPLPHLAARLRRDSPTARVHECALGEKAGEATFSFVRNDPAYSGLRRRHYDRPDPVIDEIRVQVRKLDDLIPESVQVSFIKLDIEGGEYHAMLGGARTIVRCRPVIVFEAGEGSTSHYGVTPQMLHDLVASELGLGLSTMARWLRSRPSFSKDEFLSHYRSDFYFIAYPTNQGHLP